MGRIQRGVFEDPNKVRIAVPYEAKRKPDSNEESKEGRAAKKKCDKKVIRSEVKTLTVGAAKANEGGDTTSKRNEVEEETGVRRSRDGEKKRKEGV